VTAMRLVNPQSLRLPAKHIVALATAVGRKEYIVLYTAEHPAKYHRHRSLYLVKAVEHALHLELDLAREYT
jgi:hypothetical protein